MTRFSIETQKSRHENFPLYIEVATIEDVIHSTDVVDNLSCPSPWNGPQYQYKQFRHFKDLSPFQLIPMYS